MSYKFLIPKSDLEEKNTSTSKLTSATSVFAYRRWLFDCLRRLGDLVPLELESIDERSLVLLFKKKKAIYVVASINPYVMNWQRIPGRFLILSCGNFLIPEFFYGNQYSSFAKAHLVSTEFEEKILKKIFRNSLGYITTFSPYIDTNFFRLPTSRERKEAREKFGIKKNDFHMVFAGRWIVTKGVYQLIRTLDLWPTKDFKLTLTAEKKPEDYRIGLSKEKEFLLFAKNEIDMKRRTWLKFCPAKNDRFFLRELFWSADLFVSPSIHPDENFGITPREALSCGVPSVTTNFCGLRPLADLMPWQGIDSYPTPAGLRFSLGDLRDKLNEAKRLAKDFSPDSYRQLLRGDYNPEKSLRNLEHAVRYLVDQPAESVLSFSKSIFELKKKLLGGIDSEMLKFIFNRAQDLLDTAIFYGDRIFDFELLALQSLYTAKATPPKIRIGQVLGGFFRVSLWPAERTLVEFSSPVPRIKKFTNKQWLNLKSCTHKLKGEQVFIPTDKNQVDLIQELVDLGYLVLYYDNRKFLSHF